jgi:hypothetical protein
VRHDLVEHPLQVGVGPGDDPAQHVAGAGDGVRLQHLGYRPQVVRHRIVAVPLVDLQRDERGHPEPDGGRIHVRPEPLDDAPGDQLVEPGLHGATGDPQPA